MQARNSVILVGSDARARSIFGAGVASGHVELREAATTSLALSMAESRPPDLFVIAVDDADTAITGIRTLRQTCPQAKVIVLCGDAGASSVLAGLREHAFSFLRSPWTVSDAREAISRALSLNDWEDGIEVLSANPDWVSLRLRCRRLTAERVLQFLTQLRVDLSPEERDSMATAVREILLNAIEHGGAMNPEQWVKISRIRTAWVVLYHVEDPGPGFSLDDLPHAAVSNPPAQPLAHTQRRMAMGLRPGGFGILVTRGLVDDVIYSEKGNEVILLRRLEPAAPAAHNRNPVP
jgi:anti-sigma regulatory factor (Ser/Thr protein kinase)/CheY-like chemotaxis protein